MTILANTLNATNRRGLPCARSSWAMPSASAAPRWSMRSSPAPSRPERHRGEGSELELAARRAAVVGADEPAGRAALLALLALDDEPSRILTDAKLEMINEARQLLTAVDGASPRDGMFAALAEEVDPRGPFARWPGGVQPARAAPRGSPWGPVHAPSVRRQPDDRAARLRSTRGMRRAHRTADRGRQLP